MDIAIGLPNAVPGTTGAQLVEWARRIDRIAYENYQPLTALVGEDIANSIVAGAVQVDLLADAAGL